MFYAMLWFLSFVDDFCLHLIHGEIYVKSDTGFRVLFYSRPRA